MSIRRHSLLLAAVLGTLLQGCGTAPRFDKHFGTSLRTNLAAQVIDPAAGRNTNPARGVDGPAALAAQERYQRSFKENDAAASQPLITVSRGK
jgi:type IV pilus biogenesis protein CpaD/CtpE